MSVYYILYRAMSLEDDKTCHRWWRREGFLSSKDENLALSFPTVDLVERMIVSDPQPGERSVAITLAITTSVDGSRKTMTVSIATLVVKLGLLLPLFFSGLQLYLVPFLEIWWQMEVWKEQQETCSSQPTNRSKEISPFVSNPTGDDSASTVDNKTMTFFKKGSDSQRMAMKR